MVVIATLALTIRYGSLPTDRIQPEPTSPPESNQSALTPSLDAAPRASAVEEQPEPEDSRPPTPVALPPTVRELIGTRGSWPVEFANKPLAELIAAAERLSEEFTSEINAEVERRFQDGQYVTYAQGAQPLQGSSSGITVGRGDENTIKYVDIDPRNDPELFLKQSKALWLQGEIARRQR
jgi:hypothetical protein